MLRCTNCVHYKHRCVLKDETPCNFVSREERRLKIMIAICYILGAGMIAFLIFG